MQFKKLAFSLSAIAAVAASVPAIDGFYAKQLFTKYAHTLQASDPNLRIIILSYHQGWLQSNATIRVSYDGLDKSKLNSGMQPNIIVQTHITHGPLVFDHIDHTWTVAAAALRARIDYPLELQFFISPRYRTNAMLRGSAIFGFTGTIKENVSIPAFEVNNTVMQGTRAKWDGLTSNYAIQQHNDHSFDIDSVITVGSLNVSAKQPIAMQLLSQPITLTSNGKINAKQLWIGTGTLSLPSLSYKNASAQETNVEALNINLAADTNANGLYNMSLALTLDKFEMPWNSITSLAPISISSSIKNMHADQFAAIAAMLKNSNSLSMSERRDSLIKMLPNVFTPDFVFATKGDLTSSLGKLAWTSEMNHFTSLPAPEYIDYDAHLNVSMAEPLALEIAKLYIHSQPVVKTEPTPVAPISLFNEKIAAFLKQGKITLPVAMELLSLQAKNLNRDQFEQAIKPYHLSVGVSKDLFSMYVYGSQPVAAASPSPQGLIDDLVHQGYLIRDADGKLTMDVVREKGTARVNGVGL